MLQLLHQKIDSIQAFFHTTREKVASFDYRKFLSFRFFSVGILLLGLPLIVLAAHYEQTLSQHAASNTSQLPKFAEIVAMQNQARLSAQVLRFATTASDKMVQQAAEDHNKAMQYLIPNAPDIAIQEALTGDEKKHLKPNTQQLIEDAGPVPGEFEQVHEDLPHGQEGQAYKTFLADNGKQYLLHFTTNNLSFQPHFRGNISGVSLGNQIAINATSVQNPVQRSVFGTKTVAVVLFNFKDDPNNKPFTTSWVNQYMFGKFSVNQYMQETSYNPDHPENTVHLSGKVFNWITVDEDTNGCNYAGWNNWNLPNVPFTDGALGGWINDVNNAINQREHINIRNDYDYIVYIAPSVKGCGIDKSFGVALNEQQIIAVNLSQSSVNFVELFSHEFGHTFGLAHAGGIRCVNITGTLVNLLSDNCQKLTDQNQYWDEYDTMGGNLEGNIAGEKIRSLEYSNFQKRKLNWITDANIEDVTTSGTYTIYPAEQNTGVIGLRIPRKNSSGKIVSYYMLEYRYPTLLSSFFDYSYLQENTEYLNGIIIRLVGNYDKNIKCDVDGDGNIICVDSLFIDVQPNSLGTGVVHILTDSQTFYDNPFGITIQLMPPSSNDTCAGGACKKVSISFGPLVTTALPNLCEQHNGGSCENIYEIRGKYRYKCPPLDGMAREESQKKEENDACENESPDSVCCVPVAASQNPQVSPTPTPVPTAVPTPIPVPTCGGTCRKSTSRFCAANADDMSRPDSCQRSSCGVGQVCWY